MRKNHSNQLSITVKQKTVEESKSERILGVIFSNDLTWRHHLYGEPEKTKEERTEGLMNSLSKRLGIFKKVARYANGTAVRSLAQGLYYSKLYYSLPIFAEVWLDEKTRRQMEEEAPQKRT